MFALIALGSVLKQLRLTSDDFLRTSDKLVYFVFFPVMLFWKTGTPELIPIDRACPFCSLKEVVSLPRSSFLRQLIVNMLSGFVI